jgi:hypothetical protein
MLLEKEIFAPLLTYFNSILRRDKETDEVAFKKVTSKFHKGFNLGNEGGGDSGGSDLK